MFNSKRKHLNYKHIPSRQTSKWKTEEEEDLTKRLDFDENSDLRRNKESFQEFVSAQVSHPEQQA